MVLGQYYVAAGRSLLGLLFIIGGLMFFRRPDFSFARSVIASHRLPYPALLLIITMGMQLGCGAMMLMDWNARVAATIFLVWLVPATAMFHPFWKVPPEQVPNETFHFLKNMAIAGGLLLVMGLGNSG
jgi:putative oxidoreductase